MNHLTEQAKRDILHFRSLHIHLSQREAAKRYLFLLGRRLKTPYTGSGPTLNQVVYHIRKADDDIKKYRRSIRKR